MTYPPNPPPAGSPPPPEPGQPYGQDRPPGYPVPPVGAPGTPAPHGPGPYPPYGGPQHGPGGPGQPPGHPASPGQFGPPGPPVPPAGAAKSSKTWLIVTIAAVLVLCACGAVVGGVVVFQRTRDNLAAHVPALPQPPTTPEPGNGPDRGGSRSTVTYEVTGEGAVGIVYTEEDGSPKMDSGVSLPWQKQVSVPNGERVEVQAVRTARGSGELVCRITIDGVEKDAKRSGTTSGTVNCSADVGS